MPVISHKAQDIRHRLWPYDEFWKPVTAPTSDPDVAPFTCVKINDEWLPLVLAAVDRLQYEDTYKGDEATQALAAKRGNALLGILTQSDCTGGDILLRQNPMDACQLQQSTDGGLNWITVFDFSLCEVFGLGGIHIDQLTIQLNIERIQILINTYNTDIDNFYGEISAADDNTNTAYCYALRLIVYMMLYGLRERLQRGENANAIIGAIITGLSLIGGALTGGTLGLLEVAVGAVIGYFVGTFDEGVTTDLIDELLVNEAFINELTCCAYLNIAGLKATPSQFADAWDGCIGLSQVATYFVPLLQAIVADFDTFITFMTSAKEALDFADAGLLGNECLDLCEEWCYEFDFTASDGGFEILERGQWVNGQGWQATTGNGQFGVFIGLEFLDRKISYVEMEYSATSTSPAKLYRAILRRDGGNQLVALTSTSDGTNVTVYTDPEIAKLADQVIISLTIDDDENPPAGWVGVVHRLQLRGTGINPFGMDNCP